MKEFLLFCFLMFALAVAIGIALIIPMLITYIKKRVQLGQTWEYPVESPVRIEEKMLTCPHCGNSKFSKREGLMNTSWAS